MSERLRGVLAMVVASGLWGMAPIYFHPLSRLPLLEVIAHRTIWSLVFFLALLAANRRLGELAAAFRDGRNLRIIAVASAALTANWLIYVHSVGAGRAIEASIGYYLYPLMAVAAGMLFLGERLGRAQTVAVILAAVAVGILTAGLGVVPWISLLLGGLFVFYSLAKKGSRSGPMVSVAAEVLILLPLSASWVIGAQSGFQGPEAGIFLRDGQTTALLIGSALMTGLPLALFAYAARRVSLTTLGLIQYLSPTLQFVLAALVLGETVTRWHLVALPLIWVALVIYTVASWRAEKDARKALSSAGTSAAT